MNARVYWILLLAAVMVMPVAAHQPVLNKANPTREEPYTITRPEISRAIYASLNGEPHYYRVSSDEAFAFYAGITVPKVDGCDSFPRFSFSVLSEGFSLIRDLDGTDYEWWPWFEEYGKKWYWIGPEFGEDFKSTTEFAAGSYYIKVYNASNTGNYVLAVGDIEKFTPVVIMKALITLPRINARFWDEDMCEPEQ